MPYYYLLPTSILHKLKFYISQADLTKNTENTKFLPISQQYVGQPRLDKQHVTTTATEHLDSNPYSDISYILISRCISFLNERKTGDVCNHHNLRVCACISANLDSEPAEWNWRKKVYFHKFLKSVIITWWLCEIVRLGDTSAFSCPIMTSAIINVQNLWK